MSDDDIIETSAQYLNRQSQDIDAIRLFARAIIAARDDELRKQEPVPKGFIVVSKDLLAEAIACNTDASLAEARHIINSVLKVSDDEIFREVLKEESKSDLQTSEQHQAAEIARLRRIEDAAVACAEDGQWGGETFYELMCELQKTLRGDQDHV